MTDSPDIELLRRFLDGRLGADEAAAVEKRLESDPAWRDALEEASGLAGLTSEFLRPVGTAAPADRSDAVLDLIDRLKSEPPRDRPDDSWKDVLTPPPDPNPGGILGTLGDYEVHELLAVGGMGLVFKARDTSLDRVVALKTLAPALAANETARDRFLREARAAASLEDEHILPIYGVHEGTVDEAVPWFAMRYADGGSLEELMRDAGGPLPMEHLVSIARQVATALDAAHSRGIVHRDLKPSNVLLDVRPADAVPGSTDLRLYLTDFGLARATDDPSLTYPGHVAGTPHYMAPEQVEGTTVDHRADLFGLGALLYHCATGQPPFAGKTSAAVMKAVAHAAPRFPAALNPSLPAWFNRLILNLLAKNPAHRLPSAAAVVHAIDMRRAPRLRPGRGRKALMTAAAVLLLVVLGVASLSIPGVAYRVNRLRASDDRAFLNADRLGVHDTLGVAIAAAMPGDTIVVHSSAPIPVGETLVVPPGKPLTIRAADGERPVLRVADASLTAIEAHSSIVLDGITVMRTPGNPIEAPLIDLRRGAHLIRYCSLRTSVRRPRLMSNHPAVRLSTASSLHLDHTILVPLGGMALSITGEDPPADDTPVEVTFTHTITCGNFGVGTGVHPDTVIHLTLDNSALATTIGFSDSRKSPLPSLAVHADRSVFSNALGLCWFGGEDPAEVSEKFRWAGRDNLFFRGTPFLVLEERPSSQTTGVVRELDDWIAYPAVSEVEPRTARFEDTTDLFRRLGGDVTKYDAGPIADACRPHMAAFPGIGPDLDRIGPEGRGQ